MTLTPERIDELLLKEREAQGLPPVITDVGLLTRVAAILQTTDEQLAAELGVSEQKSRRKRR